mmetsp:Transcript_31252/g.72700  ORF Transcript_31252/g.72700 Transcript_31252/m.72700 type:complete len:653 (-) Transcript_31252:833-2791(-)|eukprot:CAMPEP_0119358714 /NCGR_PEP_ID=MMETSP1334-20130426/6842_1 /TAXON_ID=127549 /ORGANISM="Calcidiscus leptoporus, Strain RCC1130" /LENGTH=652 /DNA_ID=CAMNT_0007373259 /DNA_START=24 /DNA_END=1982 /DNA_ORIENTATION=-
MASSSQRAERRRQRRECDTREWSGIGGATLEAVPSAEPLSSELSASAASRRDRRRRRCFEAPDDDTQRANSEGGGSSEACASARVPPVADGEGSAASSCSSCAAGSAGAEEAAFRGSAAPPVSSGPARALLELAEDDELLHEQSDSAHPRRAAPPLPPLCSIYTEASRMRTRVAPLPLPQSSAASMASASLSCAPVVGQAESYAHGGIPISGEPAVQPRRSTLEVSRALTSLWLAGTQLPHGLMAGAAVAELMALAIGRHNALTPLVNYADAALGFQRAYMWLSLSAMCGALSLLQRRTRARHYASHPRSRLASVLSAAISFVVMCLTFSLREDAWALQWYEGKEEVYGSGHKSGVVERLPYFAPTSDPNFALAAGVFAKAPPAAVVGRALLVFLNLALAFLPTADDAPPLPHVALDAPPPRPPHIFEYAPDHLPPAVILRRGVAYAAGWWVWCHSCARAPTEADGATPFAPVAAAHFDRRAYGQAVLTSVCSLSVDLVLNALADTVHWLGGPGLFGGNELLDQMMPNNFLLVGFLVTRAIPNLTLGVMVVRLRAYKLGLWRTVASAFKRTLILHTVCYLLAVGTCALRVLGAILGSNGVLFASLGFFPGGMYTALIVPHIATTVVYYVATVDAFRKMAHPRFHLHPEQLPN